MAKKPTEKQLYKLKNEWLGQFFEEVKPRDFYRAVFPEGSIAIGVGFLIFLGASKVFEFYTEDYADTMSLAVFLISLAVSVYFAEPIRAVIPINLLLLLILVHIVYVLIRWYVKGCMRSRGYY